MISALIACAFLQCGDKISFLPSDTNKNEAKYVHNVKKQEEKEKFERLKLDRNPSGYMTVSEYELLSAPKDRMSIEVDTPQIPTPADMIYVPQPSYKIIKYNNPPGSPELSIDKSLYQRRQKNLQGIVSPDFSKLVYPSIYYYPNSGSTACDLFVINLDQAKSNKDRILTANVVHRLPEPILSTEKSNDNYYTFRTLTPVDFSVDGTRILVKEKIGNTKDGIWKTVPYVYDFTTGVSYSLEDIRNVITYYWKGVKDLNLDDKRWDIYPLGFSAENPDWIVVNALAYTGNTPVNLGTWAINSKGEKPRLISTRVAKPNISMNGYKLIKEGVVPPSITQYEEKHLKRIEKEKAKQKKAEDKAQVKELEKSYKAKLKEMDTEFKEAQKEYNLRQKVNSSTSGNEAVEKYKQIRAEQEAKKQIKLEKLKQKELKLLEKENSKK